MEKLSGDFKQEEQQSRQSYGETLKSRRKERGITIIELAEKTGVGRQKINSAELGLIDLNEEQKTRLDEFIRKQRII